MESRPASPEHPAQDRLGGLLERARMLDLEVSLQGRILRLAAVQGNRVWVVSGDGPAPRAEAELGVMVREAVCVLGHNLLRHDLRVLRETPCGAEDCAYCRRVHNAREQLRAFFGLEDFRALPPGPGGGSLQRELVEAGMRNESLLALMPTGSGKSLCYQLPALVRNYRRGVLSLVISPLQALMKGQVDGLVRRTGAPFAAALYGLLTPPERSDVLRRIRLGDVALLYVSPEQLRNRSFREAIAQREVGCWVFDEAHCLSKWGHDFRPDYLYAGRFIREFSKAQRREIPPVACFTATAKRDVKEEILVFFKSETNRDLSLYEGGVENGGPEPVTRRAGPLDRRLARADERRLDRHSERGPTRAVA